VTPKWADIKRHAQDRIEALRNALEQPSADAGETEFIRGRIAAYRDLLGLEPRQPEPSSAPPHYD
jgi:hypothetical protein